MPRRKQTFTLLITVLGFCCLLATFTSYISYEPNYFGRWSARWLVVVSATALATLFAGWQFWASRKKETTSSSAWSILWLALGVWALAYSWECWQQDDNKLISRWTEGLFFIGVTTPGVVGEWLVMWFVFAAIFNPLWSRAIRMPAARQATAKRLTLAFGATAVMLLLVEGGFRARNLIVPHPQGVPTQCGRIFKWRYYDLNSNGFRAKEVTKKLQAGKKRIVCIGDSYTEGVGIKRPEDRFTGVLQQQLGSDYEVVNVGKGNTHTQDHLATLRLYLQYKPDLVVLIYNYNDAEHLLPSQGGVAAGFRVYDPRKYLLLNTHVGMEFLARWHQWGADGEETTTIPREAPEVVKKHLVELKQFVSLCTDQGIPCVIAPFDIGFTAHPPLAERNQKFCSQMEEAGLTVWSMDPLFTGRDFRDLRVTRLDGHPNKEAHELVGKELARRLVEFLKP